MIDLLPSYAASEIHEKIDRKASVKTVRRILKGDSEDKYGVMAIAAEIARRVHEAKQKRTEAIQLLTGNISPLKSA